MSTTGKKVKGFVFYSMGTKKVQGVLRVGNFIDTGIPITSGVIYEEGTHQYKAVSAMSDKLRAKYGRFVEVIKNDKEKKDEKKVDK